MIHRRQHGMVPARGPPLFGLRRRYMCVRIAPRCLLCR